jgi:MFS family permease
MLGSIFFLGYVSSLLWLPHLADIYGRRGFFFISMVIGTFSWVVFLFDIDIKIAYFNLFLIGFVMSARLNVGFVYLMEFIPNKNQIATCTCFNIASGFTGILITVYFYSVSKHWEYLVIPGIFQCLVAMPLSYFYESPKFLLK